MDIVLDSNIFRSDVLLKSKDFDIMLDYLGKTSSSIIMPQIILDEVTGIYKRHLADKLNAYKSSLVNLNNALTSGKNQKDSFKVDIDAETEVYISFIKKKLSIDDKNIIPYNNEFLPLIAKRAISRQKPSGENGQGFRDVLIWLTILEHCKKKVSDKKVVFISQNTDDFASGDKTTLHPSLREECQLNKVELHYFKNIKEFVENHSVKISFITTDWINEKVNEKDAKQMLLEELDKPKYNIPQIISRDTGEDCTEYYKIDVVDYALSDNHFVYELSNNLIVVNIPIHFSLMVEYEFRINEWEKLQNDLIRMGHLNQHVFNVGYTYLSVEAYISLTVDNKNIIESRIEDCHIY